MDDLRILSDENIPFVESSFGQFGSVRLKSGRDIGPSDVQGADVLLVRSVTVVGPRLLEESPVRFVGSATIGTDHVDEAYLRARNISFAHAPGSNADSVADYVIVALLALARRRGVPLRGKTAGIIGCGNVGERVARRLRAFGLTVLCNDPPKAEISDAEGRSHPYVSLNTILDEADIITLHVPLTRKGPHPTHHLVDEVFLDRLSGGTWLLNTSRGAVVNGDALLRARRKGDVGAAVLDVWEQEPSPNPALIQTVDVGTPHIAGYAYDGKVRGTAMLYQSFCDYLDVEPTWDGADVLSPASTDELQCHAPDPRLPATDWLYSLARQAYDLSADDASMRALVEQSPEERGVAFTALRTHYRRRRELQRHVVSRPLIPPVHRRPIEDGLTIRAKESTRWARD